MQSARDGLLVVCTKASCWMIWSVQHILSKLGTDGGEGAS